jgi:F-box protein 42
LVIIYKYKSCILCLGDQMILNCLLDKCLYIVGGTTHTPTTFNDMWRFELGSQRWFRCLPGGQYPTPKALASGIVYKNNFVVYGGWSHPSPYPLMQVN